MKNIVICTDNYLCARTCDSGCSLTHVLRGLNTQPYTGRGSALTEQILAIYKNI